MQIYSHPQHQNDITNWLSQFDEAELARNGWTPTQLQSEFQAHSVVFCYEGEALTSCLVYQQLGENHVEIRFLATAPQWRRKGHQQALIVHVIEANLSPKVWLECRADNTAARALYARCGFVETGLRPGYYKDGIDAILMEFFGSLATH